MSACSKGLRDSPDIVSRGLWRALKPETNLGPVPVQKSRFISRMAIGFSRQVLVYCVALLVYCAGQIGSETTIMSIPPISWRLISGFRCRVEREFLRCAKHAAGLNGVRRESFARMRFVVSNPTRRLQASMPVRSALTTG